MGLQEIIESVPHLFEKTDAGVTYSDLSSSFLLSSFDITYSTHRPVDARLKIHNLSKQYPENTFIQGFRDHFQQESLPELANIQNRKDESKFILRYPYFLGDEPSVIELLTAYF